MTLPAQIAVGNHANDGEITDLQNAMNGVLPILLGTAPVPGDLSVGGSIIVGQNLIVQVTLQVNGPTEISDLTVDTSASVGGDFTVFGSLFASFPTAAGVAQAGRIYQGSGAPSNTNGNNGDVCFRTDTPATANQRLYIKSAGAWIGIL